MLNRFILEKLTDTLKFMPAIALLGARQIGKTTLAKFIAKSQESIYLDLESPEDITKLSDPISFLSFHKEELIILDEIQRMPDLFMILRGVIDKNRQENRNNGQFLLLGSASMDLLRQSSESLAGRISYIEMSGLNVIEILNNNDNKEINRLWFRGGFPNSYLAVLDKHSMEWLEMFIRTYLERDVPQMGFRVPAVRLRRLWTMVAHLQGETLNYSNLAANLEVDGKTITHYLDILVSLLLVRRLEPWYKNVKKRLVKSPRFYVRDTGILHRLLGIANYDSLLSNPIIGKSWEGFVIENILSILPQSFETYYYRTSVGTEIDLVIKLPDNKLWAVEIKHGLVPKIKKGFHLACLDICADKKFVIYGGNDQFPVGDDTMVISLKRFMNLLIEIQK